MPTRDIAASPTLETDESAGFPVVVTAVRDVADRVIAVELQRPSGDVLPAWSPGSHIDLVMPSGLVRQYSLCSSPADLTHYRVAILLESDGRGGSAEAHRALRPGTNLTVRGPRNHFPLVEAPHVVFIAGGIGITPLLPMLRQVDDDAGTWELHYGGRSRSAMAFAEEVSDGRSNLVPQDESGLLDLESIVDSAPAGAVIYCCGPAGLLDAIETLCVARPGTQLHVERFQAREIPAAAVIDGFEVELAQSGLTLTVPPDRSILDVVLDAGIDVLSSCEDGVCGTCETVVLDGQPDHRDSVMEPEEHDETQTMQICVSRCRGSRLVLDL